MNSRGSRVEGRGPYNRSRLSAFLCALAVLTTALQANAETIKLLWGERPAAKKSAPASTALRFVKPAVASTKPADVAIRLAAYGEDAPRLTGGSKAAPPTQSVVINRDNEASNGFHAAQLPPASAGTESIEDPSVNRISQIEDGLRSPFVDNPEEPAQPNALPLPESNTNSTLPPPENNRAKTQPDNSVLQLNEQQQQPAGNPAETGQFEPILPSGPGPDQSPPTPPSAANNATIKTESGKVKESCEKNLENLRAYTVDKVNLSIAINGTEGEDYPFECSIDDGTAHAGRCWEQTTYMWKASAMCHKPLYFEDEQLERYGHSFSPCIQPFVSGAHFFCTLPVLPYCMGVEPPCECIYALGHYRPGNCAPYMCNPVPLSLRGALFEAGVVTGTAAALP